MSECIVNANIPVPSSNGAASSADKQISVVIPVYRSGPLLTELHRRLTAVLEERGQSFEIVFVEDCGGDESWRIINELADKDPRVVGLKLSRNYGQHPALLCGIRAAAGEVIITMDDDLQHPPEELPKLLDKLNEGYDVVYGPPNKEQHGFLRDMASRITKLVLQEVMGVETARNVCALRVLRRHVCGAFEHYRSHFVNFDVLLTWGTDRFASIQVVTTLINIRNFNRITDFELTTVRCFFPG